MHTGGGLQPRLEIYHSPPSITEVKNGRSCTYAPSMSSWHEHGQLYPDLYFCNKNESQAQGESKTYHVCRWTLIWKYSLYISSTGTAWIKELLQCKMNETTKPTQRHQNKCIIMNTDRHNLLSLKVLIFCFFGGEYIWAYIPNGHAIVLSDILQKDTDWNPYSRNAD